MDYTSTNALSMLGGDDYTITQEQIADVDARAVHLVGTEVITGDKTFSGTTTYTGSIVANSLTISPTELGYLDGATSNLQTQITARALDSAVVKLAGIQTITGSKIFQNDNFLVENSAGSDKINVNGTTTTLTNTSNNVVGNFSVTGTSRLDGTVTVGGDSNGSLLYFNAERDWEFRTEGVDAGTILIFQDRGSNKNMEFRRFDDAVLVRYLFNTINPRVEIYGALTTSGADVNLNGKIKSIGTTTTLANTTIAINGASTFDTVVSAPVSAPTLDTHLTNKKYVDDKDALTVHLAGVETISGNKTLSGTTTITGSIVANSLTISPTELGYLDGATSNLQTQLNATALDSAVVHLTGTEDITGAKTFINDNFIVKTAAGQNKIMVSAAETNIIDSEIAIALPDASVEVALYTNNIVTVSPTVTTFAGVINDYFSTSRDFRYGTAFSSVSKMLIDSTTTLLNNITSVSLQVNSLTKLLLSATNTTINNVTTIFLQVAGISRITITATDITINQNSTFNLIPTGTIITTIPQVTSLIGYFPCNGMGLDTTLYNKLFAIIGYTYGGSGSVFAVPNFNGAFLRGKGTQTISGVAYTSASTGTRNQLDAVLSPTVTNPFATNQGYRNVGSSGNQCISRFGIGTDPLDSTGIKSTVDVTFAREDLETRPMNYAVSFFIRY